MSAYDKGAGCVKRIGEGASATRAALHAALLLILPVIINININITDGSSASITSGTGLNWESHQRHQIRAST